MFQSTRDNWYKAKAAVIIQNLLEHFDRFGFVQSDPAKLANFLISEGWKVFPDVFAGKFARRPHKITLAFVSLAHSMQNRFYPEGDDRGVKMSFLRLASEIHENGAFYGLSSTDERLIEECSSALSIIQAEIDEASSWQG